MRRLLTTTTTLALLGAGVLVAATPAAATPRHVGVVVRYATGRVSAGCATPGGTGLQVLEQHHSVVLGAQQYSGFVLRIDGTGTSRPDNTHYWSYWHSGGGGTWTYSSSGAGSSHPRAGTVEGWSYVNGQSNAPRPPRYTYAALCGRLDPKPKPAAKPSPRATSAAPTQPARTTAPSTTYAPPPSPTRASAPAHRAVPAGHHRSARPTSSRAKPARSSATRTPTRSPRPAHTSSAPAVHTEPAAVNKSETGFPAWGTVVAVVVIAGLGVTAWRLSRRRTN